MIRSFFCLAVLACGVARAELTIFADAFSNGWSLSGGVISNGVAHSGTRSIFNNFGNVTANNAAGTVNGSHTIFTAYLLFDTSGIHTNTRFQRVNIALENPANPGTMNSYEFKPTNSRILIDGVRDSVGMIDFPDDGAWHKIEIDLTSHTSAPFIPSKVGTFSFVVYGWVTPPDLVACFVDDVSLIDVPPTNAVLSVSPMTLDLGLAATQATFSIGNAGIGTLYWTNTVNSGGAWLSVAPLLGAQSGLVTASINRAALAYGTHTGEVVVSANGDVPARTVRVIASRMRPRLAVAPAVLDFSASESLLTFAISNAGAEVLHWTNTVISGGAWLSAAPLSGMQAGIVSAAVNRAAMAFGAYTGMIAVTANGDVPAATVTVFAMKSPPQLSVAPLALNFGAQATTLTVQVWNNGEGEVPWHAASGAPWLMVQPPAGTAGYAQANVAVSINRAALPSSNTYNSTVVFTPEIGAAQTVSVAVSTWPPGTSGEGFARVRIVSAADPATPMPGRLIIFNRDSNTFVQVFYTDEGTEPKHWGRTDWPVNYTFEGIHHPRRAKVYRLPTGQYTFTGGRGMTWQPAHQPVAITFAATTDVVLALSRIVDTEARGWYSGEAHLHVSHSGDTSGINSNQFLLWAEAAGVNWLSVNQEYIGAGATNLAGQQAHILPMSNATCQIWMGGERPKSILGHLAEILPSQNPYTVLDDPPYYIGCDQVRRQGGITYPVHADRTFGAIPFSQNNFYKTYLLDGLLGPCFDAWSVMSNNERGFNGRLLGWWYALLRRGGRVAAMADSDYDFESKVAGMNMVGNWIAFVNISGQVFSVDNVCRAIREGRTFATTSPLLFFSIGDAQPGDSLPLGTHTARIEAYLPFHPWTLFDSIMSSTTTAMRISSIQLVRNGSVVQNWNNLNVAATTLYHTINETGTSAFYTVHVRSTDGDNVSAIASPIYFDQRPVEKIPMTTVLEGRVYDAFSGAPKPATVALARYGQTLAHLATTTDGFFRAAMPLDTDVTVLPFAADAGPGPQPVHRIIDQELVFSNISYTGRSTLGGANSDFTANMNTSLAALQQLADAVATSRWEFPLRYQYRNSYVARPIAADYPFASLSILSFPPQVLSYTNPMCAMLLLDKYEVAPGDVVNYAAIYRKEGDAATNHSGGCFLTVRAWNPQTPASYGVWRMNIHEKNSGLINLGNGFYAFTGAVTIPAYATNCYQGPGIWFDMYTRISGAYISGLGNYVNVGTTRRGLLVSTTWPGIPIAWPNHLHTGLGPANLTQRSDSWNKPHNDYRPLAVRINGSVDVCPTNDMNMCADTDDAHFYDWLWYYGTGVYARDSVRPQPAVPMPDVPAIAVDPFAPGFGGGAPAVSLVAPDDNLYVMPGDPVTLACSYAVVGKAVSSVAFIITAPDGLVHTNATAHEFVMPFTAFSASGVYTWAVSVTDAAGLSSTTASRSFHVIPETTAVGVITGVAACCRMLLRQR